jgi:hypothetical protein
VTGKRSVGEQVLSGLKIAGLILLTGLVFALLQTSLVDVLGRADSKSAMHRLLGGAVALGIFGFLFQTASYWSKWLAPILLFGGARLAGGFVFAPYFRTSTPRVEFLVWTLYAVVACGLSARHYRSPPRLFEKVGLVSFIVCVTLAAAEGSQTPLWLGLGVLALGELSQWLSERRLRRHRAAVATTLMK